VVRDWPDSRATWRVGTLDDRGRRLRVVGWHRFVQDQPVGRLDLHVDGRNALLITGYSLAETLVAVEQPEVLAVLVACAQQVAIRLHDDLKIGNGCLDWQLEHDRVGYISRLFPDFSPAHKSRRLRRGKRYLRWRP
jgi:hypothetical protein